MLRILVISLSFVFSINLVAQESAPAFVTTSTLNWFDKESTKFDGYIKDLKTAQSNDDLAALRQAEVRMKASLENIIFKNQFIEMQLENHLDKDNMKKLKQEWVDGFGFRYYLNLKRFRNTPGLTEISMSQDQYKQYMQSMSDLKEVTAAYNEDTKSRKLDHDLISERLNKAAQLVRTSQTLLVQ